MARASSPTPSNSVNSHDYRFELISGVCHGNRMMNVKCPEQPCWSGMSFHFYPKHLNIVSEIAWQRSTSQQFYFCFCFLLILFTCFFLLFMLKALQSMFDTDDILTKHVIASILMHGSFIDDPKTRIDTLIHLWKIVEGVLDHYLSKLQIFICKNSYVCMSTNCTPSFSILT